MNREETGSALVSLIQMQVGQIRRATHLIHNYTKCYALKEAIARPFKLRARDDCAICHGSDPFAKGRNGSRT